MLEDPKYYDDFTGLPPFEIRHGYSSAQIGETRVIEFIIATLGGGRLDSNWKDPPTLYHLNLIDCVLSPLILPPINDILKTGILPHYIKVVGQFEEKFEEYFAIEYFWLLLAETNQFLSQNGCLSNIKER